MGCNFTFCPMTTKLSKLNYYYYYYFPLANAALSAHDKRISVTISKLMLIFLKGDTIEQQNLSLLNVYMYLTTRGQCMTSSTTLDCTGSFSIFYIFVSFVFVVLLGSCRVTL